MNDVKREELPLDGYVKVSRAMAWSGLSQSTLYALMLRNELSYTKVGASRLISAKSLRALLERNLVAAG